MIFYTADTHFGFLPIIEATARPFKTIREMDETLIYNWNAAVGRNDTVYIVGDFAYDRGEIPADYFEMLNGRKHLIRGNHDTGLEHQERLYEYCESVTDYWEIDDGDDHVILCHYPFVHNKKAYMVHGHIHNRRGQAYYMLKEMPRVLNAGVDINFYRPVTLKELIHNNELFYSGEYDHLFSIPSEPAHGGKRPGENALSATCPLSWDENYRDAVLSEFPRLNARAWENEHFRPLRDKTVAFYPLPARPQ